MLDRYRIRKGLLELPVPLHNHCLHFFFIIVFQGDATDEHSLHITVSCYQLNTWGDLLLKVSGFSLQLHLFSTDSSKVLKSIVPCHLING